MAIATTDWEQYRDADSDNPPDIFFRVLEGRREESIETEAKGDKNKMIGAHKMLLAGTSPVFKANFYGPMKMEGGVLVVKETTVKAFSTMINFLYWPPVSCLLPPGTTTFSLKHITTFEELCDIVEISERYQIPELKNLAKEAIKELKITAKNVIIVATLAERYKAFEDINKILLIKNKNFIERIMKSADDVISLMIAVKEDFPDNGVEMLTDLFKVKREGNWSFPHIGNYHFLTIANIYKLL